MTPWETWALGLSGGLLGALIGARATRRSTILAHRLERDLARARVRAVVGAELRHIEEMIEAWLERSNPADLVPDRGPFIVPLTSISGLGAQAGDLADDLFAQLLSLRTALTEFIRFNEHHHASAVRILAERTPNFELAVKQQRRSQIQRAREMLQAVREVNALNAYAGADDTTRPTLSNTRMRES